MFVALKTETVQIVGIYLKCTLFKVTFISQSFDAAQITLTHHKKRMLYNAVCL